MEITARFLRACQRLPVDRTPVWFMRQAGRYMPEYRAIREKYSLLEICCQPELAAEVTLQPVRALGVDAAILFADILLPVIPLGLGLDFVKGEGPAIGNPVRTLADVRAMKPVQAESDLAYVLDTIRILRRELGDETPLIGFCGAPFTLASYVIEGGPSREFLTTKKMMYTAPDVFHSLMERLSDVLADYILAQVRAGAQAVQIFDSWVGALSPLDYETFVLPYSQKVLAAAQGSVPVIHFGTNTTALLPLMKRAGGDVFGLDWRISLEDGWALLGEDVAVQGNLDPAALFAPLPELNSRVRAILRGVGGRPGHIFNLGHGVLQHTPVDSLKTIVETVHEFEAEAVQL